MKLNSLCLGLASGVSLFLCSSSLRAGPIPAVTPVATAPVSLDTFRVETSHTFESDLKSARGYDVRDHENNRTSTSYYSVDAVHRIQLDDHWFLRLGLNLARYDFASNSSYAPNTLQSYAAGIGLEYRVGGKLGFILETRPGVYFSHDVTGASFDSPTAMALFYPVLDGKLVLVGGFRASILSKYPILPAGGFIWHIDPKWDLMAVAPRPRLVFNANENTKVYAGGELAGGTFRVNSSDHSQINGTVVDYYELRAGAGVSYKPCKAGSLDLGAGWAFSRKFNFFRADRTIATESAPFVRLQFSGEF